MWTHCVEIVSLVLTLTLLFYLHIVLATSSGKMQTRYLLAVTDDQFYSNYSIFHI